MTPNMIKGLVPLPGHNVVPFDQGAGRKAALTTDWNRRGFDKLGGRVFDGFCFHRSQGGGSVGWLLTPNVGGLTDWVISKNADATLTQINFLTGTARDLTGWAQGPINPNGVKVSSADVDAFLRAHGGNYNAWNQHIESLEVEGFYDDPIHENVLRDLAQLIAARAHDAGIAWDKFPVMPNGRTMIYGHREACGTAFKLCPGSVLWEFINGLLIEMVRAILKAAQIGTLPAKPAGPVYRRATVPAFMKRDPLPETASLNDKLFDLDNRSYRVEELTGCFTSVNSPTRSRGPLQAGTDVRIVYRARDKKWGIAAGGSRIPMAHLSEIVEVDQAA